MLIFYIGSVPVASADDTLVELATTHYRQNATGILNELMALLRQPSPSRDRAAVEKSARYIQSRFEQHGITMQDLRIDGAPPLLYANIPGRSSGFTIGIYAHYDTVPSDEERWRTRPYEPVLMSKRFEDGGRAIPMPDKNTAVKTDWRIYGRGAGDDKHNITALLALANVLHASGKRPAATVKIVLDGEEEIGSPYLADYREQYRELFDDIDLWLFFDGPLHLSNRPQVVFGVRGITGLELTVYGANRVLHSGHYGNWAPVPGQILADLLSSMKDEDGKVLIKDFYKDVIKPGAGELKAIRELARYDKGLREKLGFAQSEGRGQALAQRIMLPSLTIKGIESGRTGKNAKNAIPAVAMASLGVRLVAGMDADVTISRIRKHIHEQGFHIVDTEPDAATRLAHPRIVKIEQPRGAYNASRTSLQHPLSPLIINAISSVADQAMLVQPTSGGTLPLNKLKGDTDVPVLAIPTANYDNNQHAPNENVSVGNLWYAIRALASIFSMHPQNSN